MLTIVSLSTFHNTSFWRPLTNVCWGNEIVWSTLIEGGVSESQDFVLFCFGAGIRQFGMVTLLISCWSEVQSADV